MLLGLYIGFQNHIHELRNERGATAAEYGLLVAFIALVVIVGITAFGNNLNAFFQRIATRVAGWAP